MKYRIILAIIILLYSQDSTSQTLDTSSVNQIVDRVENDEDLKLISVTDEDYLNEMADFNGNILGYFKNAELQKIHVFSVYGGEIYKYYYYLSNGEPIYACFFVSEYDGDNQPKLNRSKSNLIRGDEMYFDEKNIFYYRSFEDDKWTEKAIESKQVMTRNQNILNDIALYKKGLKGNWPQQ